MIEVSRGVFVGQDADVEEARDRGMVVVTCAKHGPYGHARLVGYPPKDAAPMGHERLWAIRGNHLAINVVDTREGHPEAFMAYSYAVGFVVDRVREGREVLVHCNRGLSRGPGVALAALVLLERLPMPGALKAFMQAYPSFNPAGGVGAWLDDFLERYAA